MRLAEGIYLIRCPFGQYYVAVCAVVGKGVGLVDSGIPSSPEEAILPYLRSLGREPGEVSLVALTHGHFDHCGGVQPIKRVSKAECAVHELDAPLVEDPDAIYRDLDSRFPGHFPPPGKPEFEPSKTGILMREGEAIEVAGVELEVLHTPGHSAGSVCLAERDRRIFFSGDSIQGRGPRRPLLFQSSSHYLRSMRRLSSESIDVLVTGHSMPPFMEPVLTGDKPKMLVEESIRGILKLNERVLEALRSASKPVNLSEMAERLVDARPSTVGCVLEKLVEEGRAEKRRVEKEILWRAT